jgi:hypothetical protein
VYVRKQSVIPGLDKWLGGLFDDEHIHGTCGALAEASPHELDHDAVD